MRRSLLSIGFVLTMGLSVGASAETRTFHPPAEDLFGALGAHAVECPVREQGRYMEHIEVRCASTDQSLKSLRKRWRDAVDRGNLAGQVLWDRSPWKKEDDKTRRFRFRLVTGE